MSPDKSPTSGKASISEKPPQGQALQTLITPHCIQRPRQSFYALHILPPPPELGSRRTPQVSVQTSTHLRAPTRSISEL